MALRVTRNWAQQGVTICRGMGGMGWGGVGGQGTGVEEEVKWACASGWQSLEGAHSGDQVAAQKAGAQADMFVPARLPAAYPPTHPAS